MESMDKSYFITFFDAFPDLKPWLFESMAKSDTTLYSSNNPPTPEKYP